MNRFAPHAPPPEGYRLLREGDEFWCGDIFLFWNPYKGEWQPTRFKNGKWRQGDYFPMCQKTVNIDYQI